MLKPPISRMGGKSRLRKKIIELIPEHTCYVEPFFGAGWVYFGKDPSKVEVINDIDKELINLFKIIKYHEQEVSRLLQYEICSRDLFNEYMQQDSENLTDIQRAIRFIYILSQSFASKGNHFGYGTTSRPKPQIFTTDHLKNIKSRLRNTYIENLSFQEIFRRYDRKHTFFFCDPPYLETTGYKNPFTEEHHQELNSILSNIEGKFLLTINDHPKIREWYKDFNIAETRVGYSVSRESKGRKKYSELIIMNY
ncbi:DNA adenine methylase [Maledivibacter halophilus]|uniref:site-specific DNA-methyltransferase (adenine-specific) n=1 Tax=Maledivibacter halophilus TaxID=36842 RepID=A0A1T5KG88_9FIRM|nr:DNA adenine methylase [Maledivibacter halophilus]SKC62714.1 DNA adenine methylase [Maledivibacter halophilus]